MRLLVIAVMASVGFSAAAKACRNPADNTVTLLRELPENTLVASIVAKVEIVEISNDIKAEVKILEAIKGTQVGQTFYLSTGGSSCDEHLRHRKTGEHFYVAGRLITDAGRANAVFFGRWRFDWSNGTITPERLIDPLNPVELR